MQEVQISICQCVLTLTESKSWCSSLSNKASQYDNIAWFVKVWGKETELWNWSLMNVKWLVILTQIWHLFLPYLLHVPDNWKGFFLWSQRARNCYCNYWFKKLITQNNMVEFLILEGLYFKIEIFSKFGLHGDSFNWWQDLLMLW